MPTLKATLGAGALKRWEVRGAAVRVAQAHADIALRLTRGPQEVGFWDGISSGASFNLPRGVEFDALEVVSSQAQSVILNYSPAPMASADPGLGESARALVRGEAMHAYLYLANVAGQYPRVCLKNTDPSRGVLVDDLRVGVLNTGMLTFYVPGAELANAAAGAVKNRKVGSAAAQVNVSYETGAALASAGVEVSAYYLGNSTFGNVIGATNPWLLPPGALLALEHPVVNTWLRVAASFRMVEL